MAASDVKNTQRDGRRLGRPGHGSDDWPDTVDRESQTAEPLPDYRSVDEGIQNAEREYVGRKNEWGRVLRADGRAMMHDREGDESSVPFYDKAIRKMALDGDITLFHTHITGNSFSLDDLKLASAANLARMITTGKNYAGEVIRHEIIRPAKGWPDESKWKTAYDLQYSRVKKQLYEAYKEGRITWNEYNKRWPHEVILGLEKIFKFRYAFSRLE
ncbi:MAG: hypothetical protein NTX50_20280 [Candidatus Sumerlaeota bacterium]|nr:hypothetical protein [Candidatus Sumerlaeota bacterium]